MYIIIIYSYVHTSIISLHVLLSLLLLCGEKLFDLLKPRLAVRFGLALDLRVDALPSLAGSQP